MPEEQKVLEETPQVKSSRPILKYLIGFFILFFIMVICSGAGIFLGSRYFSHEKTSPGSGDTEESSTTTSSSPAVIPTTEIKVTLPELNQEVKGKISVKGEASGDFSSVIVKLYDNNNSLIGSSSQTIMREEPFSRVTWSLMLDVTKSPTSPTGKIVAYFDTVEETSSVSKKVPVKFGTEVVTNRLNLYTPLRDQMYSGEPVLFKGQMSNFFEGTMGIRLKSNTGALLFKDVITASGNNYEEFASFEKAINFGSISFTPDSTGTLEFYEESMADGSIYVLLSIPYRFPKGE